MELFKVVGCFLAEMVVCWPLNLNLVSLGDKHNSKCLWSPRGICEEKC